jgi:integrase
VDCRDPLTGERRRLFYATRAEAEAKQTELNSAPIEPLHPLIDPEVTLERYAALWEERNAPGWKPRTRRSYHDTLTLHVLPFPIGAGRTLGTLRIADLQRGHVQALVEAKAHEGYAPDSVKLVFGTIRSLCDAAVGDRLLRVHPIDPALRKGLRRLWRRTDSEPKPFTVDQMQRFLATAREESSLASLYEVGFLAGLRLGELTGLQLDDLVVTPSGKRKLRAERQLGQHTSMLNPEPTPPKSGKSRQVDAGARLCAILDGLSEERKPLAVAKGWRPVPPWAFVTRNGTPINQRFVEKDFRRVCEQAKLPDHLTPHSMRHTFACLHIGQGCNAKWLQQQMGHSSINVTLDTYAKWWNLEDHAAADALGALVGSEVAAKAV